MWYERKHVMFKMESTKVDFKNEYLRANIKDVNEDSEDHDKGSEYPWKFKKRPSYEEWGS